MATFTVTTAADVVNAGDGKLSLREAVTQANATAAADTIVFASGLEGKTLLLTGGDLLVNRNLTIRGDANADGVRVTLDGGDSSRLLDIHANTSNGFQSTNVTLTGINLQNGEAEQNQNGGAIYFGGGGTLSINSCAVSGNHAGDYNYDASGGAILARGGTININSSIFSANSSAGGYSDHGGAIAAYDSNVRINKSEFTDNRSSYGGALFFDGGASIISNSRLHSNTANAAEYGDGGAIDAIRADITVVNSTIDGNSSFFGGGIQSSGRLVIDNSTIANNVAFFDNGSNGGGFGGGILAGGDVILRNSTVTGNSCDTYSLPAGYDISGGGIRVFGSLEVDNSIIVGNWKIVGEDRTRSEVDGTVNISNGHNIFGSDISGNVSGDRENITASSVFASVDPDTGGGVLSAGGVASLRNSITNPALSGADLLAAADTGQSGTSGRPLPAGTLPDIGSIEINQPLSTTASANNDVLTGTAAANTINAGAGADYVKGLGGKDTLHGNDGGDLLDGGTANDKLFGDAGIDLVFYGGSTKVTVDLSLATDKATRGSEIDTLFSIEGAIGSSAADTFKGNEFNNYFQGGLGKDTASGGSSRDTYDFNSVTSSPTGTSTRDGITDFDHLVDKIDLSGIDANTTVASNQVFRWVGTEALTGPGEVGYFISGNNTIIRASNDGDAASELEIQLTGIKTLSIADFYL